MNIKEAQAITINRLERQLATAEKLRDEWCEEYTKTRDLLVAEKLRADTLATYLGDHAYVINCGSCIMRLERTPEEWQALALGGKEQK